MFAETAAAPALSIWQNFYVIVGSSAGALTGLQFVVIALVAEMRNGGSMLEVRAFGSPTVVQFGAALVVSAILSAPWPGLAGPATALAVTGAAGLAYTLRAIGHARTQTGYAPDAEDWLWYLVLPLISYAALAAAAVLLPLRTAGALFAIAGITLALLLLGIRNSWDTVTYIAVARRERKDQTQNGPEARPGSQHGSR
ncbi:MAG TPA: hypothetical protein VE998_01925 [Terriglobales bacterium]|nr:hypothetical protein [Terriglobales bacterium]